MWTPKTPAPPLQITEDRVAVPRATLDKMHSLLLELGAALDFASECDGVEPHASGASASSAKAPAAQESKEGPQ